MKNNKGKEKKIFRKRYTHRNFAFREFIDQNGIKCKIQKSSLALIDCIWLGADDIGLKEFRAGKGWKSVELGKTIGHCFVANNRMHLNRKMVKKLIPVLQKFVETGDI